MQLAGVWHAATVREVQPGGWALLEVEQEDLDTLGGGPPAPAGVVAASAAGAAAVAAAEHEDGAEEEMDHDGSDGEEAAEVSLLRVQVSARFWVLGAGLGAAWCMQD